MAFRMSEQARTIKIYNLLAGTNEFIGEGDAYIPPHTGLPANSTDIAAKWHLNRSQFGIRIDHDLASISDHSLASQSITIWHAS
ncbi:hypothetical protein M1V33_24920, partial [Escherichia coli]|nr:hypothetical protein [Escherichia coli]